MDRTKRTLTIALAASLALNLFCVGFVLGRRSGWFRGGPHGHPHPHAAHEQRDAVHERRGGPHRHPRPHDRELGPRGFLRRAGLDDAGPEVAKVLEARRDALRAQRTEVRSARARVSEALVAEPFDAAKLTEALNGLQAGTARAQAEMHTALVEVATTLSIEQRRRLSASPWLLPEHPPGPPR